MGVFYAKDLFGFLLTRIGIVGSLFRLTTTYDHRKSLVGRFL